MPDIFVATSHDIWQNSNGYIGNAASAWCKKRYGVGPFMDQSFGLYGVGLHPIVPL